VSACVGALRLSCGGPYVCPEGPTYIRAYARAIGCQLLVDMHLQYLLVTLTLCQAAEVPAAQLDCHWLAVVNLVAMRIGDQCGSSAGHAGCTQIVHSPVLAPGRH
jgi:hypothetical protein